MPLTKKGATILGAMKKKYGSEKGATIFYASERKGKIAGVKKGGGGGGGDKSQSWTVYKGGESLEKQRAAYRRKGVAVPTGKNDSRIIRKGGKAG